MMKKQIDLKILIDNDNYLKKYLVDNNESITPTTDKGYFSFEKAVEKLKHLESAQKELVETEDKKIQEEDVETSKVLRFGINPYKPTELEESLKDVQSLQKQGIFIKKYAYDGDKTGKSEVLRFGIDTTKKELIDTIKNYNNTLKENLKTTAVNDKNLNYLDKISNISGETNYKKFVNFIPASNIEEDIVNHAIQYLKGTNSKTVLVDALPRVLNSKIDNAPVGTIKSLETHTTLLYYNGTNVLVIDPNNPQFSAFLENVDLKTIKSSYRANDKIYTRHGESGPELWRDCIDIAVKLAFVLNHSKENYKDITSIIESKDIKLLSNNDIFDNDIFYSELAPIRKKQTSNLKDVFNFSEDLSISRKIYDDTSSILKKHVSLDILSKLADKLKKGFFENLYSNKILSKDQTLSEYIINCKLTKIDNVETDLSGAIDEYFQKCEESHE